MGKKVIITALVIIVLVGGWYLVSPLFITTEVNEDFPLSDMSTEAFDEMEQAVAELDIELPELSDLQQMTADEINALEQDLVIAAQEMPEVITEEAMPVIETSTPTPAAPVANGPIVLRAGSFVDADSFHTGSGNATIYELADGSSVLRFEDFETVNGPDLRVILTTSARPESRSDVQEGYIELAKLKGNKGNQNYEIPADVDLNQYNAVVVYCKPFHVIFTSATLSN